ncbi:MAG: winged helix-turn-helix transcriptional regulator [Alphaproteobacteria bacterium]|nr:winged helix-turn-helix transcriptional regulator [Alphaproteobacteria bacterium]
MAPSDRIHAATPRGQAPDGRPKRNPSEVARAFGFLVHDVSRLIKRRFERRARQMGLPITRQQAAVVLNIAGNEGVSQAEVAAWLDIEPIALVRMLDKLHEEGLVERRAHPTDRRVRTLWLTPAAQPVVTQILAINEAIREEAFSGMAEHARDTVIEILDAIKGNLALREEADDSPAVSPPEPDLVDQPIGKLRAAAG